MCDCDCPRVSRKTVHTKPCSKCKCATTNMMKSIPTVMDSLPAGEPCSCMLFWNDAPMCSLGLDQAQVLRTEGSVAPMSAALTALAFIFRTQGGRTLGNSCSVVVLVWQRLTCNLCCESPAVRGTKLSWWATELIYFYLNDIRERDS